MSNSMKAAFIKQFGPPENIIYDNFPIPKVGEHDVLVKTTNIAVNHVDTYIRSGKFSINLSLPYIFGRDLCGIVEAVGKGIRNFSVGDSVWSCSMGYAGRQGSYADFVSIPENLLYKLPDSVDPENAVGVFQSAMTACHGLIRFAQLKKGETILINGGSGSVGSTLIQLAKTIGARIIATAGSKEKVDWCLSLGAEKAINYKNEDVSKAAKVFAPEGINVYWDTSKEPNFETAIPLLAPEGRFILMAGADAHPTLPVGEFYRKNCAMYGFSIFAATIEEMGAYANIINRCLAEGQLQAKIDRVLPLNEAAKAHKLLEIDKTIWGKIVLKPE
jgi:NADPH:quinone reductase